MRIGVHPRDDHARSHWPRRKFLSEAGVPAPPPPLRSYPVSVSPAQAAVHHYSWHWKKGQVQLCMAGDHPAPEHHWSRCIIVPKNALTPTPRSPCVSPLQRISVCGRLYVGQDINAVGRVLTGRRAMRLRPPREDLGVAHESRECPAWLSSIQCRYRPHRTHE